MKNINPLGVFDDYFLLKQLTKLGDPLEKLDCYMYWKIFKVFTIYLVTSWNINY